MIETAVLASLVGLLLQLLLALTSELESKIYAFGGRTEENICEIQMKIRALGPVEKRSFVLSDSFADRFDAYLGVKIFKEDFENVKWDELNIEPCKVILCNPVDSRSALLQPLEYLYHEGEGIFDASTRSIVFALYL
jgi:hypothetical protein